MLFFFFYIYIDINKTEIKGVGLNFTDTSWLHYHWQHFTVSLLPSPPFPSSPSPISPPNSCFILPFGIRYFLSLSTIHRELTAIKFEYFNINILYIILTLNFFNLYFYLFSFYLYFKHHSKWKTNKIF